MPTKQQTAAAHNKQGVAVPFLDLTKVIPNFSLKQQEKQLN